MSADRFQPGHVLEAKTGGYLVKSCTTAGAWWFIGDDGCSCPADVKRCFHVRQVEAFVRKLNDALRRPSAPPHISALVD